MFEIFCLFVCFKGWARNERRDLFRVSMFSGRDAVFVLLGRDLSSKICCGLCSISVSWIHVVSHSSLGSKKIQYYTRLHAKNLTINTTLSYNIQYIVAEIHAASQALQRGFYGGLWCKVFTFLCKALLMSWLIISRLSCGNSITSSRSWIQLLFITSLKSIFVFYLFCCLWSNGDFKGWAVERWQKKLWQVGFSAARNAINSHLV